MAKPSGGLKNINTPKEKSLVDLKTLTRKPIQTEITPDKKQSTT